MISVIKYYIDPSVARINYKDGPHGVEDFASEFRLGLWRFKDFFAVSIQRMMTASTANVKVYARDIDRDNAAQYDGNGVISFNTNPSVKIRYGSLQIGAMHEMAHRFLNETSHNRWAAYTKFAKQFGEPIICWSHVLWHNPETNNGGAGYHFQGTFSPHEVDDAIKRGIFKLASRPVHPWCIAFKKMTAALRKKNLPRLKSIVNAYGKHHAHLYDWQTEWLV